MKCLLAKIPSPITPFILKIMNDYNIKLIYLIFYLYVLYLRGIPDIDCIHVKSIHNSWVRSDKAFFGLLKEVVK